MNTPFAALLQVQGVDVHWLEVGEGRPCVLLHGLSDSHRTWSKIAPLLARGRRVLMPDLPGHGLSGRPDASYALDWHARIIGGWMDALGLDEVDLVGHSFGGGVAQWILLQRLERVRRLALVAPGGLGREVSVALRLGSLPGVLDEVVQPMMGIGTNVGMRLAQGCFDESEIAELSWMNARPGTARALGRTIRDVIDVTGQRRHFLDRAGELPYLPPMAVIWGERDRIVPAKHAAEAGAWIDGASEVRLANVGHFPHRERPIEVAASLAAFVDTELPRSRLRKAPVLALRRRPPSRGARAWRWFTTTVARTVRALLAPTLSA